MHLRLYSASAFPLQKIFGSNLTLHAREARGIPQNQWFSLAGGKVHHSESNLVSTLVTLYNAARTYFEQGN
jgi:hypothetical protein